MRHHPGRDLHVVGRHQLGRVPRDVQRRVEPAGERPTAPSDLARHVSDTTAWLAQIDCWYAQQTAAFLQELDATPDFDGNSLLDNTVVVYVTEVARAWDHDWRNVPFLVFGGKNTRIQGGQFIKVTDGSLAKVEGTLGSGGPNRSTNDVWLALAPIFGVNLPSLGDPKQYQSALPGLVA